MAPKFKSKEKDGQGQAFPSRQSCTGALLPRLTTASGSAGESSLTTHFHVFGRKKGAGWFSGIRLGAYFVSQRILRRCWTERNSGSLVKTVALSCWAVAMQNASA